LTRRERGGLSPRREQTWLKETMPLQIRMRSWGGERGEQQKEISEGNKKKKLEKVQGLVNGPESRNSLGETRGKGELWGRWGVRGKKLTKGM